ncbi:MAG: DUF4248 domain-containing protein [Tannerellaceae bacterium]|nr:DUF4248 domain-containing protein [Tannerellaceae bacterium]
MKNFVIKTYGLQELAILYFPFNNPASASTQLKRWVTLNKKLTSELQEAEYYSDQRLFTPPRQVSIILKHLGSP